MNHLEPSTRNMELLYCTLTGTLIQITNQVLSIVESSDRQISMAIRFKSQF